jgi:ketosteroid isomerase-like protein
VDDLDAFLAEVMPRLLAWCEAVHDGDIGEHEALWSHHDPVTLFGNAVPAARGWTDVSGGSAWVASNFRRSESFEYDVLAAGVSGDLGYVAGIERSDVTTVEHDEPVSSTLRVTTVFRREHGEWKVVHRHGDRYRPPEGKELTGQRWSTGGRL